MFNFTITFKLSTGTEMKVAYRAGNKREAIFYCSNELARAGLIDFEYVSIVEHALV